jgi:hypothetical protein
MPKIKIIKLPEQKYLGNYQEIIDQAIINNKIRNEKICEITKNHTDKGENVLIFVDRIEHLNNIVNIDSSIMQVYGNVESEIRSQIKIKLKGNRDCGHINYSLERGD